MKKNINIEFMRFMAVIAVIFTHMAMGYYHDKKLMDENNITWMFEQVFYTLTRFCVPLFFIIAAYLAFNHKTSKTISQRMCKIIIPFVIWSLVYYIYNGWDGVSGFVITLLTSKTSFHLWFIPVFIGYCFFLPFVVDNFSGEKKEKYRYIFYGAFIFSIVVPTADLVARTINSDYKMVLGMNQFSMALPQYLLYAIAFPYLYKKVNPIKSILLYGLVLVVNVICNVMLSMKMGKPNEFFYGFAGLGVFISSYIFFNIIMSIDFTRMPRLFEMFVRKVGELSFGIYLSHWLVYSLLVSKGWVIIGRALVGPILNTFLVFSLTFIFVFLLSRIRVIRFFTC